MTRTLRLLGLPLLALLAGCPDIPVQPTRMDPPSMFLGPMPGREQRMQQRIDARVHRFRLERFSARGIDARKSRAELSEEERAVVDDVDREARIYNRYLVVLARRSMDEGLDDAAVYGVLNERAYPGQELLDEALPEALENRNADRFRELLDWVPPHLRDPERGE